MANLMSYLTTETTSAVKSHLSESAPGHSDRGDGGALLLIDGPDGSVLFQDTSDGTTAPSRLVRMSPSWLPLERQYRWRADTRVLAQFVAQQVELLDPQKVLFGHHDDWLPGFSVPVNTDPIIEEIRKVNRNVEILEPGYLAGTKILP